MRYSAPLVRTFTSHRQIRNCVMIHRTTTAVTSIAITQVITIIAHIVREYLKYA